MNWYKRAQINDGKIKVLSDGSFAILGRNTKPNEWPWRISFLTLLKTPRFHMDYETYEEAEERFNLIKGEEKNVYELV
jgi:hypothetical protein